MKAFTRLVALRNMPAGIHRRPCFRNTLRYRSRLSPLCPSTHGRTLVNFSVSAPRLAASRRTGDFNAGYASTYDPTLDNGRGPMFSKTTFGVPAFYPRDLKQRVDEYVVGQDRAKKTICSAIFNHYQNVCRRHLLDEREERQNEKLQRQKFTRERDSFEQRQREVHPVEDEFPGHVDSVRHLHSTFPEYPVGQPDPVNSFYIPENSSIPRHVKIDKTNLLLLGPTGVGKTYILETLSKTLNVPFTISDCNTFTQAGYIGQDVETCIERLLIEANYDTKAAEHGIIVLDEFDKIAKRETHNGRDVGGEGVQQALLKLVEGSKVTINVKDNRPSRGSAGQSSSYGASGSSSTSQSNPPKVEQYTIDTSNILFVFCGAFVGLEKHVLRRVSKTSMGFGADIRKSDNEKEELPFKLYSHLPHQPAASNIAGAFTPLDLTTPADLQEFGFIPELIGRVHNVCALSSLSLDDLFHILTEPRNSLVAQKKALFETYPSKLHFTRKALYAIAERAAANKTGARALKMEMERVLAEPTYESPIAHVLITEGTVKANEKPLYWGKDGWMELERRMSEEDHVEVESVDSDTGTFEQYREAGQSGA